MTAEPLAITHPELIIGIAGAIGIDVDAVSEEIAIALQDVGYAAIPIRVTKEMMKYPTDIIKKGDDYFSIMNYKMSHANKVCEHYDDPASLMRVAIQAIDLNRNERLAILGEDAEEVLVKTGFVVRQLKRPSEVALMRRVYGKQFILVSAYGTEDDRSKALAKKIKASLPVSTRKHRIKNKVNRLIERDFDEESIEHGQHLRDTFHLADIFVDGINRDRMRAGVERFFQAFFGRVDIGPSKTEYGMYAAKAASLRSTDLSRQVGAALFTRNGEIVSQGCNEVPKAFGGTYWDGEEPDNRDVRLGYDPNDQLKKEVVRDLVERLAKARLLNTKLLKQEPSEVVVDMLLGRAGDSTSKAFGCLSNAEINDLTEYGRVIHAEMLTICDAARLGRPAKECLLYVTTFPCHNCTKHILASGIREVIFMEPYPKSKAKELHSDEIELEKQSNTKVSFIPFLGISPYRYRDIFEKKSRKRDGKAVVWYKGDPRPMLDIGGPAYLDLELFEIQKLGGEVQPKLL